MRENESYYERVVLPSLEGARISPDVVATHRRAAARAADQLERALTCGGTLAHPGRQQFSSDAAMRTVASWRRIAESH